MSPRICSACDDPPSLEQPENTPLELQNARKKDAPTGPHHTDVPCALFITTLADRAVYHSATLLLSEGRDAHFDWQNLVRLILPVEIVPSRPTRIHVPTGITLCPFTFGNFKIVAADIQDSLKFPAEPPRSRRASIGATCRDTIVLSDANLSCTVSCSTPWFDVAKLPNAADRSRDRSQCSGT